MLHIRQGKKYMNNIKSLVFLTILYSLFLLNPNISLAQKFNSAPLFDILKKTADSTIIFSYTGIIYEYPDYYIISKTGDTVNMYTYRYKNLIEPSSKVIIPRAINRIISHRNLMMMMQEPPDINALFEVKIAEKEVLHKLWQELAKEMIWKIKDDVDDGEGCPSIGDEKQPNYIYDGGGLFFKLITKDKVKDLRFYAPHHFEKYCPGRAGRISAIKVEQIIKTYFLAAGEKDFGVLKKHNPLFRN